MSLVAYQKKRDGRYSVNIPPKDTQHHYLTTSGKPKEEIVKTWAPQPQPKPSAPSVQPLASSCGGHLSGADARLSARRRVKERTL